MPRAVRSLPSPPGGGFIGTNAPYDYAKWGIPFIHLSSGTMGNNGAITALTTLPTTFTNGAWCLFPAGAIAAGVPAAAAWLWVTFASATAGTAWNATYTTGVPTIGTQTAFSTTGPGAFTGLTTENNGPSISLGAGVMGNNGRVELLTYAFGVGAGGSKTFKNKFGATTTYTIAPSGTGAGGNICYIANMGVATAQTAGNSPTITSDTTGTTFPAENTAAALTIAWSLQKAVATDHAIVSVGGIRVAYGL